MNIAYTAESFVNFAYMPQIQVLYCDRRKLVKWHATDVIVPFWRLYWNNHAGAYLQSDTTRYPIEPDFFTLIAPNTKLSYDLNRKVEHFHTHFTAGLPFAFVQKYVHRFPATPELIKIMQRDYTPYGTQNPDTPWRAAAALTLCWHALLSLPRNLLEVAAREPRLNDLLRWWEDQKWRAMPNSELAGRLNMETTAFCRLFKRVIGQTPHAYGLLRRIDQACLLLRFSTLSVKEIAEATGFYDRYHFSHVFKQIKKTGPSAFRRNHADT